MPVFTQQLRVSDYKDPEAALREMAKHIRYIQEQLEYTLTNLDSTNVTEIQMDVTDMTSASGKVSFTGDSVQMTGAGGESFVAGAGKDGVFRLSVTGAGGKAMLYMNGAGELVITRETAITVDGGEW